MTRRQCALAVNAAGVRRKRRERRRLRSPSPSSGPSASGECGRRPVSTAAPRRRAANRCPPRERAAEASVRARRCSPGCRGAGPGRMQLENQPFDVVVRHRAHSSADERPMVGTRESRSTGSDPDRTRGSERGTQRVHVPVRQLCAGLIRTFEERQHRLPGRGTVAHVLVHGYGEMAPVSWRPRRCRRLQRLERKPCGFRCGIGIEGGRGNCRIAGPEPEADHLVRVRFARDRVRAGISGARRPENRVSARSKLCQNRCTGLLLPLNQPLNVFNVSSANSKTVKPPDVPPGRSWRGQCRSQRASVIGTP